MKRLFLVFGIVIALAVTCHAESLKLDIGEWAPYTSEKDPKGKIAETIVVEALKLSGYTAELAYYPWKRSYENVKAGKAVGTFPWFENEERKKEFIFHKEPIMASETVFFHLKSTAFDWETMDDLKKYKFGGTLGYSDEKVLKEAGLKVESVPKEETNFKKMLGGRIDAYPANIFVGYGIINKLFSPDKAALFTNHPKSLSEGNMYMLISKNIPNGQAVADALDAGLKKLKESGRYQEIIDIALSQ
ncbi:MAG: transporter substrate-binding domain-containing protein [Desulfobacterales bacterium]|nr:transporter substrate-binding domain-containing protein [Desulfobacterales bacterium]